MMGDERFTKQMRLRSRADFRRAYAGRASVSDALVRLVGGRSELAHPRLGVAVSREHGGAVVRNRWKRLLREAFRRARGRMPAGLDFVAMPRAGAKPELRALEKSLVDLAWRLAKRLKERDAGRRARRTKGKRDESEE